MIFKLRKNNGYPNVQFSLHEYKYPKRVSLQSLYIKCNALSKLCLIKVVLPRIFHILSIYLSPEKHLRLDWKQLSAMPRSGAPFKNMFSQIWHILNCKS